jgi:transposase InsO family protein
MRHSPPEKMEIIRTVEGSNLPVKRTLEELDVNRSTFYEWYRRYQEEGYDGLRNRTTGPRRFWNRIPEHERARVIEVALEHPEKSPRELAWHITDTEGYYISESSVYRILKANDLVTSPAYIVISARDKFQDPPKSVHELWQTDFTYFKIVGWGWYYLGTVMDDYSRYILSWRLSTTMRAEDVRELLDDAIRKTGATGVRVRHMPRLLSDNGACYVSGELQKYLRNRGIKHIRSAPYHPMTQGKIERYHRSMKNVITLQNYYLPGELKQEIDDFVEYYNNRRYHESLDNMKPVDVYMGKDRELREERRRTKVRTLWRRRVQNMAVFQ